MGAQSGAQDAIASANGITPMPLTDAFLRTLPNPPSRGQAIVRKSGETAVSSGTVRHADSAGLYLEATAAGGRYWRLKYRHAGKESRIALGVYPDVSLKGARAKCEDARKELRDGKNPGEVKRVTKRTAKKNAASTFEAVARKWLDHAAKIGKKNVPWSQRHKDRTLENLVKDVFPHIGSRPVASLTHEDVESVIDRLNDKGAGELAARTFQRMAAVFRYAVTRHKCISVSPMTYLKPCETVHAHEVTPRAAMPLTAVPAFLEKLEVFTGDPATRWALYFLMITGARPGEVRGALWSEVDLQGAMWVIPASRMKMRRDFIVPLSAQALEVLATMKPLSGHGGLVFPSPRDSKKPLSDVTFNRALDRMGYKGTATAHGFRALFSTSANQSGKWNPDAIERQLAHVPAGVRETYNRAKYIEERTRMMQWYVDFLEGKIHADVIPIKRAGGRKG